MSETTMLSYQLQLAGTASTSVGIGWYPSVGFDNKKLYGACARDCDCGSTIGISVPPHRLMASSYCRKATSICRCAELLWARTTCCERARRERMVSSNRSQGRSVECRTSPHP